MRPPRTASHQHAARGIEQRTGDDVDPWGGPLDANAPARSAAPHVRCQDVGL